MPVLGQEHACQHIACFAGLLIAHTAAAFPLTFVADGRHGHIAQLSPRLLAVEPMEARGGQRLASRQAEQFPAWPDLIATWRKDLERIASQFAAGVSTVDPKRYPQTCQYCDLQPFCRIRERLGEPVTDAETGE